MEIQTLIKPEFWEARGSSLLDNALWTILLGVLSITFRWIGGRTFLVRYSLRLRLAVALAVVSLISTIGLTLDLNPFVVLLSAAVGFSFILHWVLRDVAQVGITNAFVTTRQGVSAESSLKQVQKEMIFLGIGAKKLTDSPEFERMLTRCKKKGGNFKFLLSHPDNTALEEVAKRNDRDDLSYQSRVKESIREIFSQCTRVGVNFEVRVYNLKQKIALPHFRLMFIDDQFCIFSQVFWSKGEGLDNPQLILTKSKENVDGSLFWGYRQYFDDLWSLDTTKIVDKNVLDSWKS